MMVIRFRSSAEHEDLIRKVKKMRKFTEELEECLEDAIEDGEVSYRHEEEEYMDEPQYRGRYSYRRDGSRMGR